MDTARASQLLDNIYGRRVQRGRCAQASSMFEFFVGDINGSDDRSEPLPDLHRQVTQAADTEDRQTLACLDFGVLQSTVDRDSSTKERRSVDAGKSIGNFKGMTRGSLHEFRVSAIHGYAGNLL